MIDGLADTETQTRLEERAQIMYLIYDCLAVNEVYNDADSDIKDEFRDLMIGYNDVWECVPLIHATDRFHFNADDTLLTLFSRRLHVYEVAAPSADVAVA